MVNVLEVSEESGPEIGSGRSVCTSPTPDHGAGSSESDLADSEPEDICGMSPIEDCADVDNCHDASTLSFLDMTHEDSDADDGHTESVLDTIKRLTVDAKKHKSFKPLFHLNALEQFVEVWVKYQHNPKIKGPKRKASHTVAVSIGRGYYRNKFLKEFDENERYLMVPCCDCQLMDHRLRWTYQDDNLEPIEPNLGPGEQLHVPIFHNESIFRANDLPCQVWVHDGRMPLQKKGQGCAIHVSDFIVVQSGRLTLSPAQIKENSWLSVGEQLRTTDVREIIYPGKNHDGFWTNDKLVKQVSYFVH